MSQQATIAILALGAKAQTDHRIAAQHSLHGISCPLRKWLGGSSVTTDFRCVDTDKAHQTTVAKTQGVTIDHLGHRGPLIDTIRRAVLSPGRQGE